MNANSKDNLKRSSIKNGALTLFSQLITVIIQITSLLVLSRLLSPTDFGLMAMVTAITAFMGLFRDMGLSTAAIQKKDLSHAQMTMLFWLNVAMGFILMLLTMLAAPLIAAFYQREELQPVIILLATTFLISSLSAQHSALMQRELRFKPKVIADIVGALITLFVAVTLALNDFGFWALAYGSVLGALVTTLMYFQGAKFKPGFPKRVVGVRNLIGFGANVTLFELFNYFHRNLDKILIGRVWGAITLGLYDRAYQMMMLPITSLRKPINAVAFPVLSKLQDKPNDFKHYYQNISLVLAFLSMPLMAFLTVNADIVVKVALGPQWQNVTTIFMLLGVSGFIQPVASLRGLVLLSLGQSKKYLAWGIINALVMMLSFILGVSDGAEQVALYYALANYLLLYPSLIYFFKGTPITAKDFFVSIKIPFFASIISGLCIYILNYYVLFEIPVIGLLVTGVVFLIVFIIVSLIIPGGSKTVKGLFSIAKGITR